MSLGEAALLLERGRKLPKKTLCLTFDDGYLDNFTVARAMLEAANLPATFFVATAGLQEGHHYSWEQKDNFAPSHVDARTLAELAQNSNLIEIGGHTHTHPRLALLSPDEQYQEIEQNRQLLTDICGSAPRVFAYPFGQAQDFNDASVEQVKRAGYEAAVCTTAGILSWRSDRFRIRRVDAHALSADDACVLIDKTFAY
jgi:peptidoglycan/xylan/chitin deacetylase (PgdA/CDA1 family)